jgi:hypothetical protein
VAGFDAPDGGDMNTQEMRESFTKNAEEFDGLMVKMLGRIDELESLLRKILEDSEVGVVPKSHLDKIEEILK